MNSPVDCDTPIDDGKSRVHALPVFRNGWRMYTDVVPRAPAP
jgi:hypothetical protein